MHAMGIDDDGGVEVHNARDSRNNDAYADFLYKRLQRNGSLYRDSLRMVNNDRNVFAACMLAFGHADAMVTGLTRSYFTTYDEIRRVIDPLPNHTVYGLSMIVTRDRTVFMSDTQVNELPTAEQLAQIAKGAAATARRFGHEPRVALLSYANFGHPEGFRSDHIREARRMLAEQKPDFEFDGEMSADVALNPELQKLYPFMGLSGPANVLVMPALHSANLSSKLLQELGAGTVIGPLLSGLERSVQIVPMNAGASDLVNMAALAAFGSDLI
jgi:malate dehydrogenase (oxaloacetate-decarboxylating)(NADP+)